MTLSKQIAIFVGGLTTFLLLIMLNHHRIPVLNLNRRPPYKCLLPVLPALVKDSYDMPDPTSRLYFRLAGRLGNNLMELASIYGLAKDSGRKIFIHDGSFQGSRILKLFPGWLDAVYFVPCIPPLLKLVRDESPNKFSQKLVSQINGSNEDLHVSGYLGVWKYWWPRYEADLRKILVINRNLTKQAEKYLLKLTIPIASRIKEDGNSLAKKDLNSYVTYVGIQVRRGDKSFAKDGWNLPRRSYFKKAMNYFRKKFPKENLIFVAVSESKFWAKYNIRGPDVVHSTLSSDLLELALLSKCDHMIMSSGTYSWWAAWLTGGHVVYYQNHTKNGSDVASWFNDNEFFLPHWVPLGD